MKRFVALITAIFVLLFSLNCLADGFSDMPAVDSQYYKAFEYAVNNKIINGSGGKLLPSSPITKAEALTFISRVKPFTKQPADLSGITDISGELWYYKVIAQAVSEGIIVPSDNKVAPTEILSRRAAWDLLIKTLGTSSQGYTPVTNGEATATRGDFIAWIFELTNKSDSTAPTETVTDFSESPTEVPTEVDEYSALKAKAAQEAMQVALGVRADGTSYVTVNAYRDYSQTDWASGKVSASGGSSSNRPNRPSRPSGGSGDDEGEDEPTEDTNTPTEAPTDEPTNNPTNPPVEEETEAPTAEPTYGEYDGPIDNDKDNVIDDPFDDGWTPPGSGGNNSGDDSGDDSGSGGWDEEDDFDINDDDDPDYGGDSSEKETEAPSDAETDVPSEGETEVPSEIETDVPSETETEVPSETETDVPSEGETEVPSETETDVPSEGETDVPSETDIPSEGETDVPSDTETDIPSEDETDNTPSEGETPSTKPEDDENLEESNEQ